MPVSLLKYWLKVQSPSLQLPQFQLPLSSLSSDELTPKTQYSICLFKFYLEI